MPARIDIVNAENKPSGTGKGGPGDDSALQVPPWARASIADLVGLDFEAPVAKSQSADSTELSNLFWAVVGALGENGASPETPAARVFNMLGAVAGMRFKPRERDEPFGAMMISADGHRSAHPSDFRGPPAAVLADMAVRAKHPVLRARLADTCWFLDRKKGSLAATAAEAYVQIVEMVDGGTLTFPFEKGNGALTFRARDLLQRALLIGRAIGSEKAGPLAARQTAANLRTRSFEKLLPIPALWFGHLDLEFRISDPAELAREVEVMITHLQAGTDSDTIVDLWRLAARAYHLAKRTDDEHRSQCAAAEQLVTMASIQPSAMLSSTMLMQAIRELHGVPGKKDKRNELRHRLIDVQSGISEEMSAFSLPSNLEEFTKHVEQQMQQPSLRDKLFAFAAISRSPDPKKLTEEAEKSIGDHPLSSLFAASHHDSEGKVIHRSEGAGLGDSSDSSAVQRQIAQHEGVRRHVAASGIEVARQAIAQSHYLSEEVLAPLLLHSPFVPQALVMTYSRGFVRFFQGDFVSGLYILTPYWRTRCGTC
jgi:hypothetical protein